jgi:hypothetical protein
MIMWPRFYRTSDVKLLARATGVAATVSWMKFAAKSQIAGVNGSPFMWRAIWGYKDLHRFRGVSFRGTLSADGQWLAAGGWRIDPPWQSRFALEYVSEMDPDAHFGHVGIWEA